MERGELLDIRFTPLLLSQTVPAPSFTLAHTENCPRSTGRSTPDEIRAVNPTDREEKQKFCYHQDFAKTIASEDAMDAANQHIRSRVKKRENIFYRFGFFVMLIMCMLLASSHPTMGGAHGVINGNTIIWYIAVPLTYLEAGLTCSPKSLYAAMSDGYLLAFVMTYMYILMPLIARIGSCLLTYARVNAWLLKGMEVLYCMPPPFTVSLVLSRLANADLSTSVVTTLISHFGGLFISPILLYFMVIPMITLSHQYLQHHCILLKLIRSNGISALLDLGASTPPLVGINIRETMCSTLLPFGIGMSLRSSVAKLNFRKDDRTALLPRGLLLVTAYHWFCDAVTADVSSLHAIDILLCVFIACIGQIFMTGICWILCSRWLPRNVLVAAIFTSTQKSIGLGGWLLRGAYHGYSHGSAVSLPLSILPAAQLLLGGLLASWIAP